jgi:tripartite-type tricarboxylate transporter receptor subunit TctC
MRIFWSIACTALLLLSALNTYAQPYRSKPVRLVFGFAPGGGTDVSARAIVQEFSEGLKQRVVIDNRPGANGVLGTEVAAKPDDLVRVLSSPDILHIIVCGDPSRNRLMVMEGGHTQPSTRLITPRGDQRDET